MTHDDILARLDARADGTLPPDELALVERHLAECGACRAEAESLDALLTEARELPRAITPERDLWSGIEARLTPVPTGGPSAAPARGTPVRRLLPLRPLLLAAGLGGILIGAALATWWQQGRIREPSAFALEQARYVEASAALATVLAADPGQLAPETQAVVGRSLAIVDQAIAEAEAALEADPGNGALERMLLARYEQRLGLLRRATEARRQES